MQVFNHRLFKSRNYPLFLGLEHLGRFVRTFFMEDKSQTLSKESKEQRPVMRLLPQLTQK